MLVRDELRAACRSFRLDDSERDRTVLSQRLLDAAGRSEVATRVFSGRASRHEVPERGDVVLELSARSHEEAEAMRQLLHTQRASIEAELKTPKQLDLVLRKGSALEREQAQQEKRAMENHLPAIDRELETEPEPIRQLYRVELRRLEPVGLVYLWPETRG